MWPVIEVTYGNPKKKEAPLPHVTLAEKQGHNPRRCYQPLLWKEDNSLWERGNPREANSDTVGLPQGYLPKPYVMALITIPKIDEYFLRKSSLHSLTTQKYKDIARTKETSYLFASSPEPGTPCITLKTSSFINFFTHFLISSLERSFTDDDKTSTASESDLCDGISGCPGTYCF